jgi:methylthioribose-1-phosphate isomerase
VITPLEWAGDRLRLLDQRALPERETWIDCRSAADVAQAIRDMVVRGAPAIGIAAAYGMALGGATSEAAAVLVSARPTARNLAWAVERMARVAAQGRDLVAEADAIHREDVEACRTIGRLGAALVPADGRILTQCNAGALATGGFGTALGVPRTLREAGRPVVVYAPETRPFLQGARLTAWELAKDGIEVVVVTDNAVGHLVAKGEVSCAFVGADRIAANGDTANKIGTAAMALACAAHGVPLYVAAPTSTLDLATADGAAIPIEERAPEEVAEIAGRRIVPPGVAVRHPAFDVTPAKLIAAIVTEKGVARSPYEESLGRLGR